MIAALLLAAAVAAAADSLAPVLVDDFERPDAWSAHPADGVRALLAGDRGHTGRGLRLDFDFQGGGGYAIARRSVSLDLPPNYAFSFWLRGVAPANTLEFKLLDDSGENVWWYTERDRSFDGTWHRITVRRQQIAFAWGPAGGGEIHHVAAIELVITAGRGAGRGSVWFDDLTLAPRPTLGPYDQIPLARAGRSLTGHPAALALDGDTTTSWRAAAAAPVSFTVDFQRPRDFGGVTLYWGPGRGARDYDVLLSDDARHWEVARQVRGSDGGRDDLYLPDSEARYLRLRLRSAEGAAGYALSEFAVLPLEAGASRNAFFQAVAAGWPAGTWPRYLAGRRAYWTVVGVDGAAEEALVNEDGAVEAGAGEFSVEPFLALGPRLLTWADAEPRVWLRDGTLPMPGVERRAGALRLSLLTFAIGPAEQSSAIVRYRVHNDSAATVSATLYLAVRPFQVNPPWQFLNTAGGVAHVDSIRWTGRMLRVNGSRAVIPFIPPARVAATSFDGGEIVTHLRSGRLPPAGSAHDPFGAASAVMAWPLSIAAGDSAQVAIEIPLVPGRKANLAPAPLNLADEAEGEVAGAWHERLDRATISLPPAGAHLAQTIQSTLAYILVNRDGPSLQPGSRSYERSWIRDGALTSAALLRFGQTETVREFIDWYARFQYPSGKIPCCVDRRGADPVPEHDSHGEFIYLVMEYWRHSGDMALLQRMWPHVERAAAYLDSLRQTRRTLPYRNTEFFGLLPPSISHEGYSARPMHSYWDDFFALRGFRDAAAMARLLGDSAAALRFADMRDEFRGDLLRSLERTMTVHHIDYLPGAADLGDFDATSTTIALTPVGEQESLPRAALERTFERYWQGVLARRDSAGPPWEAYTPYELRTVGSLLRLGWKDRALSLLEGFLADQEPPAWNQWPEVVWHDPRAPKFIGDSPHTWVGSDFLRSAADLFVMERERDSALVLAAGVADQWLADSGVQVRRLSTWWGPLSYVLRREGARVLARVEPGLRIPPGGIRFVAPNAPAVRAVRLDGVAVTLDSGAVVIRALPAELTFDY